MRRLPIYFLIDVSESMVGEPITQVEKGMRNIIQELRTDPYALETVFVSVIVFAGKAKVLSPLTELYKFYPPQFPIGGGTSLGTALDCLMNDIDKSVKKTTVEMKGDWKPIIFLFTDGMPTDNPQQAFNRWNAHYKRKANLVCISIGDNTDTKMLGKISDNVLRLNDTGEQSFKAFSNGLRLQSSQQVFLLPIWELMKSNLLPHRELTLKRWIRLKTAPWMRTLSYCSANVQIQKEIPY